jgi:23S rRNA pseudouridine1911/1915/1917 synthase
VTLEVPATARGERLDRFLVTAAAQAGSPLAGLSRARLQALVAGGHVSVDGVAARSAKRLRGGESVGVALPPPQPLRLEPEPQPLDILYEDHDLIVVSKPAGVAVHPGAGRVRGTLVAGLLAHCKDLSGVGGVLRPGIVHRLDRGTSGVLVAAKSEAAHVGLARQFASRRVEKRYVAFVLGMPAVRAATLKTRFRRHPTHRLRFTSKTAAGKEAVTSYEVVASAGGLSRLDIRLGTGRTHQIRVHMAESGHPIAGDPLYGGRRYNGLSSELRAVAERLTHQALHAAALAFVHPHTGEPLRFVAPLPADLEELWRAMVGLG